MTDPVHPRRVEFLERGNYRQRRFRDAARMIPVFAAMLMLVPLLWPRDTSLTSTGVIYLFSLWVVLIVVSFALSRVLRYDGDGDSNGDGKGKGA